MTARKEDLDHLLDQARTTLPGSSDAGLKGNLFDVFHEFFNDSNAWVETISVPIIPGSSDAGLKGNLFDVFHEFFNDSNAWVETISVPIIPGSSDAGLKRNLFDVFHEFFNDSWNTSNKFPF